MTTLQLRLACTLAMESSVDLSAADDTLLFGFGLPDFKPVTTDLRTVAKCMRWQCQQWDGGWDWKQYNEDLPHYRRAVHIVDLGDAECRALVLRIMTARLQGGPVTWLAVEAQHSRLAA